MNKTGLNEFMDRSYYAINDNFLSAKEIKALLAIADKAELQESTIYDDNKVQTKTDIRKSKSKVIKANEVPLVDEIRDRVANLIYTRYEPDNVAIDLIKYENKGFLKEHQDPFMDGRDFNRVFTAIIYLKEPLEGGRTIYPHLSLSVEPKAGKLFLFKNIRNGIIDEKSIHLGEETKGEKVILVMFFNEFLK